MPSERYFGVVAIVTQLTPSWKVWDSREIPSNLRALVLKQGRMYVFVIVAIESLCAGLNDGCCSL